MIRAFGYVRVSTESQADDGNSLQIQRDQLKAICAAEGYDLIEVYEDAGVSGGVPLADRPAGAAMLATVKAGDVVVCAKLDRCFRNLPDALLTVEALKARNVGLYLKDSGGLVIGGAVGSLVFSMLASVAQFEKTRIHERVIEGKRAAKGRGLFAGGAIPFGSVARVELETRRGGKVVKVTYLEPDEGVRAVTRQLIEQGYSSRLAAGHFASLGMAVSHHACARLMRELRAAA